jgi:hypothetical protein
MKKHLVSIVSLLVIFNFFISSCSTNDSSPDANVVGSPSISTSEISLINQTTALSGGILTSTGNGTILSRGICYSINPSPTIADTKISKPGALGSFTCNLSGLTADTQYYVRAYASNITGIVYGNEVTFTTTTNAITLPILTTFDATAITQTTASSGGEITSAGGTTILARGVCWSTTSNPTITDNVIDAILSTGPFTSDLINLEANTTYYVRAFATNANGTGYGNEITFTTSDSTTIDLPTITTTAVTDIFDTTAISGGNVLSEGGAPVTARGICYSITPNPTTLDDVIDSPGTTGPFTSLLEDLDPGTIYYVRAFATNAGGTVYGNEVMFTTL